MTTSTTNGANGNLANSSYQEPALEQLQGIAKSIALSITSMVVSSRDELRSKYQFSLIFMGIKLLAKHLDSHATPTAFSLMKKRFLTSTQEIKCLESAGVQNEDELMSVLEKCIFECLVESKPKDRSPSVAPRQANQCSEHEAELGNELELQESDSRRIV